MQLGGSVQPRMDGHTAGILTHPSLANRRPQCDKPSMRHSTDMIYPQQTPRLSEQQTVELPKSNAKWNKKKLHKFLYGSSAQAAQAAGVRAEFQRTHTPPSEQVMLRRADRCLHAPLLCNLSDSAEAPSRPHLW